MIEYLVEQQLTIAPRFTNNSNCSQFSADMNRPDISETEKQNEIQSKAKLKEMSIVSIPVNLFSRSTCESHQAKQSLVCGHNWLPSIFVAE